jgi:hypothetical protein
MKKYAFTFAGLLLFVMATVSAYHSTYGHLPGSFEDYWNFFF